MERRSRSLLKNYSMNKLPSCFYLVLLMISVCTVQCVQGQDAGVVEYQSKLNFGLDSTGAPVSRTIIAKTWFKDSIVIFEVRINLRTSESTQTGTVVKISNPVWKYSMLNLQTMVAQDYLVFKDTAMPVSNYRVQPNESITWVFYRPKTVSDTAHGFTVLSDTAINSIYYKRVKVLSKFYPQEQSFTVYYLKRTQRKHIFQLNKSVDEIYQGWKIAYSETYDKPTNVLVRTAVTFLRDSLTDEEDSLFSQWSRNAMLTNLPLLSSLDEAQRVSMRTPAHENPTIEIVPNAKKD